MRGPGAQPGVAIAALYDTKGTVTLFNTGAEHMLSYASAEIVNHTTPILWYKAAEVMQKTLLNLDSFLGNLLKMLRRLIGENISIEFKGNPKATQVSADSGMIEQVVMNLVVNARDAMQNGGRITLTTSIVELTNTTKSTETRPSPPTPLRPFPAAAKPFFSSRTTNPSATPPLPFSARPVIKSSPPTTDKRHSKSGPPAPRKSTSS